MVPSPGICPEAATPYMGCKERRGEEAWPQKLGSLTEKTSVCGEEESDGGEAKRGGWKNSTFRFKTVSRLVPALLSAVPVGFRGENGGKPMSTVTAR